MTEMTSLASDIRSFNYGASEILRDGKNFQLDLDVDYCCKRFAPYMSSEEANAIPAFLSTIIDKYADVVYAFIIKKPVIEKDEESQLIIKIVVQNSKSNIDKLLKCLISKSLANRNPAETALFDKYNSVNLNIKAAYGI